jgi:hypothetical protein
MLNPFDKKAQRIALSHRFVRCIVSEIATGFQLYAADAKIGLISIVWLHRMEQLREVIPSAVKEWFRAGKRAMDLL